jgi:hypothetical protein
LFEFRLDWLEGLVVINHQMTLPLPTEIGELTSLKSFNLFNNGIPGAIHSEVGNFALVANFNLAKNKFTGPIPTTVGQLTSCGAFNVGNNNLDGEIPTEVGNMVQLRGFFVKAFQRTFPTSSISRAGSTFRTTALQGSSRKAWVKCQR